MSKYVILIALVVANFVADQVVDYQFRDATNMVVESGQ